MSFASPRVASATSRLAEVLQANVTQAQQQVPVNRRLQEIFDQAADGNVDVVEHDLDEANLPTDQTQRERHLRELIKLLQEDNRRLRFDLSKLVQFIASDGVVSADKRLILAINDTSLQPFDGVEVRNTAYWTERFVDTVALYRLNADQALELFKRKLKNKASDNYAQSTNARAKSTVNGALEWLDMTYIWTENETKKLAEIKSDSWKWEEETFGTFLSRFNAYFGSYDAKDSDKMDYLLNAIPSSIRNTIRTLYLPRVNTYQELVMHLANGDLDEYRPKKNPETVTPVPATSTPATSSGSSATTSNPTKASGTVNAVIEEGNEPQITGEVNLIQNRGGSRFNRSNQRSGPPRQFNNNNNRGQHYPYSSQPRNPNSNRRRFPKQNNGGFTNNPVNSPPTAPNNFMSSMNPFAQFYHPYLPTLPYMGYPVIPPPNFNPANPQIPNTNSGNGK